MSELLPPPIYSQEDPDDATSTRRTIDIVDDCHGSGPQILIIPTTDAVNFQKGYLGAEGERAAIEGELQIKGLEPGRWIKVTMLLSTIEMAYKNQIELGSSEVTLFSQSDSNTVLPSSFPFAIPLMPDTPQSISTPHSSLSHILTAKVHPLDPLLPILSKSLTVHTRRYTSHSHTLMPSPEVYTLDEPTRVDVQVPRTTFRADEDIPIYITIPPPTKELVIDQGLRLRNVRAELVRVMKVKREDDEDELSDYGVDVSADPNDNLNGDNPSSAKVDLLEEPAQGSSSKAPTSPIFLGSSYRVVLARSGASCRFHSLRPVKLRFILHQASSPDTPPEFNSGLPNTEYQRLDADAECASITQLTLLHSITFRIRIHVSFVDTTTHTERIYFLSIPVTILPPPAPLPEIAHSIDAAYHKKHDRPPAKTVRVDEDFNVPRYSEGEAGPSMIPSGAPPPFEERDAPPPFFTSASSSNRLPTFLESETEIILPDSGLQLSHMSMSQSITGEGTEFGFPPSDQFDGHSEDMQRSSTPPPTLEMATQDTNLTQLADIREPELAIEALGLVIDQHEEAVNREPPPPPPPAMDDPSDPPPSIDSDFRSPGESRQTSPPHSPPLHPSYHPVEPPGLLTPAPPSQNSQPTHGHAPPPYLTPGSHGDEEHVTRPPPYVD